MHIKITSCLKYAATLPIICHPSDQFWPMSTLCYTSCSTDLVDRVEVGNNVEANLWTLVLQLCEKQWQQVFNSAVHTTDSTLSQPD